MAFGEHKNSDDILIRNVIVGLLNVLNRKLVYLQAKDADTVEEKTVPFFYQNYGDERFMQDFFMINGVECEGPKYAEGNIDPVPRGIVNMTSMTINSASLTNRFIRGTFNKEIEDEHGTTIKAYSAYLNPIPLTILFDVEIRSSSFTEALKIIQQAIDTFYKVVIYAVDFNGLRIPCQVGFSQDYSVEKPVTYSYGEDNNISVKFTLEMETYQPVFDKTSERFRGNIMDHGIGNVITAVSGLSGHSGIDSIASLNIELSYSGSSGISLYENSGGVSGISGIYNI